MGFFGKLLSHFGRRQSASASDPNGPSASSSTMVSATVEGPSALSSSIIHKVPIDILLDITDYLPPSSAIAFSLSCKQLKHSLFASHLPNVISSTEDTLTLLSLLALDLPNHVVCSACKRLHDMQNLQRYNCSTYGSVIGYRYNSLRFLACVSMDRNHQTWFITYYFGATAFNMAIKRYHHKPACTQLLDLMSSPAAGEMRETGEYVRLFRDECRIIHPGHLIHRLQSVHIRRGSLKANLPSPHELPVEFMCPHLKFRKSAHHIGVGVKRCQECRTEYRIDFKYYAGHGLAIFFTRCKDLGPSPEDHVWKQHLRFGGMGGLRAMFVGKVNAQINTPMEFWSQDNGELSAVFGDGDDCKFDSWLTAENQAALFRFQEYCAAQYAALIASRQEENDL